MSYTDFENWNPMADDYTCKTFNSYTDLLNPQVDPKSLYIKSIPATLSEEAFLDILTKGGKQIKRHLLYPAKHNMNLTCGLVTYFNENDALDTKSRLNGKPPFYWKIEYALNNTENKKNESSEQRHHDINGRGRGRSVVSEVYSGKGLSVISGTSSLNCLTAVGRGRAASLDPVHSLTVCLQGGQRIAYKNSESVNNPRESTYIPDLPNLIPSQCLFCKKKGELSCEKCGQTYCSINCQHQDWPNHKSLCKSLFMTIQKQNQFAHDSSYMSEGSSSDNEKKINYLSVNPPVNRNQSGTSQFHSQNVTSAKPRISPSRSSDSAIQRKFIRINEVQEQELSLNKQYMVSVCKIYNPSNFWVHIDGAEKVLYQMEKEMTSMVQKINVKCTVDDVCCTFEEGKFLRVAILKVMPNSSIAKYIDYGGTSDLLNNKLYFLPQVFKKYPAQAVCCNLVDGMSRGNVTWSEEEISSFKYHTKNKLLMGHVHGLTNNIYNIALMNDEGVSLYSILKAGQLEELDIFSQSKSSLKTIPSVLSDLKKGDEVSVGSVQFEEDTFWGFLENGSRTKVLKELKNCLQKVDTEDISLTCEEGDIAVGFSPSLNQFYRCIVLKRHRNGFFVRYIDYGNTEMITKLQSMSPVLLQKKSYVICCKKPAKWSIGDIKRVFEATRLVTVKTVNSTSAELSFSFKNGPVVINCYPWYHETTFSPLANSNSSTLSSTASKSLGPKSNIKCFQSPRQKISLPPKQLASKAEIPPKSVITKDLISDKVLNAASIYEVNIVWMKDVSEIYVQLVDDEDAIKKLSLNINKYCNSDPYSPYSPIVNEIVCCKFESDALWYRAQVTEKNKDKCKVFFIDYGNEAEVSINNIKQLPQKFAIPKFSFCVSLHKIKNEDINEELLAKFMGEKWSMEVLKNSKQQTRTEVMLYLKGKPVTEMVERRKNHSKTLLQFQELPVGISKIVISYVEADKIYVQQQKDLKKLLSLQRKIDSLVKTDVSKLEIGNVYCCLSSDGCWYRGLVKEIFSKSVLVNYIDYGNDENISVNNLKELPDDLFSHPVYCVPTITENSKPELNLETILSVEVIGKKGGVQLVKFLNILQNTENPKISDLKKLSLEDGVNDVKISFCEKDIFFCHLKSHFSDFDVLVKKLVEAKLVPLHQVPAKDDLVCAKSNDGCWYRASVQSISEKDLNCKVFFMDYGKCEDVTFENIQCLSKDLLNFPMFCVPVKIMNIEKAKSDFDLNSVFSVKTVGFSNDNVHLAELILPSKAVLPKLNSLQKQLLPTDKKIDVSVCCAKDETFYVQLASSKELLTTLEAELTKAAGFKNLSDLPEIGDLICAKYSKDIWCRGSVEKVFADRKSCEICFIDYGNCEVISLENMKFLPVLLCTFPVLSVPVKFRNIEKLQEIAATVNSIELIEFPVKVIDSSDETFIVDIAMPEDDIQLPFIESERLPDLPVEVITVYQEADIFYVQRVSNAEKLQEMMIDLQDPVFLKKLLHRPKVGELCNVKHDGEFYRAIIKEQICENKFKVFFVDYGNLDVVEFANIYCIPSKYSSLPGLCTPIKFDELVDVNVVKPNEIYTITYTGISNDNVHFVKLYLPDNKSAASTIKQDSLEKMKENEIVYEKTVGIASPIIDNSKRYMLTSLTKQRLPLNELRNVIFHHQEDDIFFLQEVNDTPLVVDVQAEVRRHASSDPLSHNPVIGELLCARSQADGSWYRCCVEEMMSPDKWRIRFIDYGNDEIVIRENLRSFIDKLAMYPSFAIPVRVIDGESTKTTVELGKVYSVLSESSEDAVQLVKLMPQQGSHTHIPSENIPIIDNNTNSEVTEICHNPSDSEISVIKGLCTSTNTNPEDKYFYSTTDYVQFPDGEQDIIIYSVNEECLLFCAPFNPDAIKANLELAREITEYCENLESSTFNRDSLPEWDELVLAKYDEDKQWYRAVIVDNQSHPFYDVIFVDYGNAERVSIDSIRKMEKNFMSLPIQTHLCSITGFTINPNSLLTVIQELNIFGVFGNGTPLKASVISEGEEKFVNIPEITEHLLEKKLVTALEA